MGTDYDAWLRGHCVTCQLKHHKRMLDGSLGIVLGGEVRKEAEVRLGILIHHEKLIRHSLEHSDPAARPTI